MTAGLAACPTCGAPAENPCVGPDGKPCVGVHSERVTASVRRLFGAFAPPVPQVNGKPGAKA